MTSVWVASAAFKGVFQVIAVSNNVLRIRAIEQDGAALFQLDIRDGADWRTLLGNGMMERENIWSNQVVLQRPDHELDFQGANDNEMTSVKGIFSSARAAGDTVTLCGGAGFHSVEMSLTLVSDDCVYVTVKNKVRAGAKSKLGQLMTHLFLIPDGRASRSFEPLEFAWLPNLHLSQDGVCGDHFFRSPAVMAYGENLFAAIVPDLDVFAKNCRIQHALDFRVNFSDNICAPRLSYGFCPYQVEGHVYTRHTKGDFAEIEDGEYSYSFFLFAGKCDDHMLAARKINSFIWEKYGRRFFADVRPQVLPFEEYGSRYTYKHELPMSVRAATVNGKKCAGIDQPDRRGSNFTSWENDLQIGFGIRHYGDKWGDKKLRSIADGIIELFSQSPRKQGAFPCIYNFNDRRYEGMLFWTGRAVDFLDGYDSASMGVSAWWLLYWHDNFNLGAKAVRLVRNYANFLKAQQLPSGAIPTYFFKDLRPAKQLKESATTAISGAVLARMAEITGDAALKKAALKAGEYVTKNIVPDLVFNDFETYYSCSPKPMHAIDYWSGIRPQCNLSVQWSCDQMLALYKLTGNKKWLRQGEFLLAILSFYQQSWDPAHRSGYLYGGFGVMNTDGEWNDGRQSRFVFTYADYYLATGNVEYLERAVAACRASFALMDTSENHANDINDCVANVRNLWCGNACHGKAEPGMGVAGENIHHGGTDDNGTMWTGLAWSSGGGLSAAAYLERHFGSAWVDGAAKAIVPIDGVKADILSGGSGRIVLDVRSALTELKAPYRGERDITIKFGRMPARKHDVVINGQALNGLTAAELTAGITVHLAD